MRKYAGMIAILLMFLTQGSFADALSNDDSAKECGAIADACKNAGFTNADMGDKSFWFGCMKPVLFGKSVSGVTVDAKDVKACRKAKIAKMQKELKELQAVK